MVIPDEIRKCVCFAGLQKADGTVLLAGTVFLVTRPLETLNDRVICYAVTAKHVIDGIKNKGVDSVLLRMNMKGSGASWVKTALSDWEYHPTDPNADVAVMRFAFNDRMDHKNLPLAACATKEVIATKKIDIGDEVFLTGLFVPHVGRKKNIPIVRLGNIAAMPDEKVSTKVGDIDAYLIEARSIGGLSGSPVFVNIAGVRHGSLTLGGPQFFLLGLMHGHFDSELLRKDISEDSLSQETVNMGIGIVVPIEKVMETINQPKLRIPEDQLEKQERGRTLPTMDTLTEHAEEPFTKEKFEDALKQVSRRIQPSQSDEGK